MIYIGFSTPNKWKIGAEAIKWWTKSPYSHVYIRFESSNEKVPSTVYHAAHGMVHFRSYENFLKDNKIIKEYKIEVLPSDRMDVLVHCMNISGDPYGFCELIKIFVMDVAHWAGKEVKFENGSGYICSELVGTILQQKWQYKFDKPLHLLKPNDIDKALENFTATAPAAPQPKRTI